LSIKNENELRDMVVRKVLASSPEIGSIWVHETVGPNSNKHCVAGFYDTNKFSIFKTLGYVEFTEKTINLTTIGEAFADFLIQQGYQCAYVNGKILIENYKISDFTKQQEKLYLKDKELIP
jgi:predicted methyltransferase